MKLLFISLLAFILLGLIAGPALAQQPGTAPDLPGTAGQAVGWIQAAIIVLSGLVGMRLTEAISNIPYLRQEDKSKLRQPLLDLTAAVIAIGAGYLLSNAAVMADFLDKSGWWTVILWAWPAAYAWFLGQKGTSNLVKYLDLYTRQEV